jgi:D-methionine transport system ATP-binding protein
MAARAETAERARAAEAATRARGAEAVRPEAGQDPIIRFEGVSKSFTTASGTVHALKDVSVDVTRGDIHGVIGYSGSGKSTLIRCANGLEKIDGGTIIVNGRNLSELSEVELRKQRQKMGMIFQHFNLLKYDTAYKNIALPLRYARLPKRQVEAKTRSLLELIGMTDKTDSYPSQLSGGQKQRVAIARALANDPELLLCDEPTSALDPDTTHSILEFLKTLNQQLGLTILLITHEMTVVKDICNHVTVLSEGEVVEQGQTIRVFTEPRHEVTKQFTSSLFEQERVQEVLEGAYVRGVVESGGLAVRMLFRGEGANEALISHISQRFSVQASVIFGSIELVQSQPIGNLYVALQGEGAIIRQALDYARDRGVLVEVLKGRELA